MNNRNYELLLEEKDPIHWSTHFGKNVKVGHNVVIEKNCYIGNNTTIGHNVVIRPNTIIGNNCKIGHGTIFEGKSFIGDRTSIHAQCNITMGVSIEEDVFIASMFCGANTPRIVHGRDYSLELKPYIIRRAARIGIGVLLFPGIEIGNNAQLGIGAVVTKDVPAKQIWVGNPAHYIKDVPQNEIL